MSDFPTYQQIPNSDIDPESPVTTSLMTLLRDNPIALASRWVFSSSGSFTIPYSGYYQVIALGGGQGGQGGGDGSGGALDGGYATSSGYVCKHYTAGGYTADCHTAGVGGTSSVYVGATNIITAPGGGSTSLVSTKYGSTRTFTLDANQGAATAAGITNPFAGGTGGSSFMGSGGAGGSSSTAFNNGHTGTGYGAGGGGGSGQDGNQAGSYGNGGMSGRWGDTLVELAAGDVLTVTIGAGGGGTTHSHSTGGNGTQGIVFVKWWPDTASLGL